MWLLVGAVASHKLVVGFCLGCELSSGPGNTACRHFTSIIIFTMGSVAGIGIGMIVTDVSAHWSDYIQPILQGLAAGTLLYVTVCEVLPRERARWHNQTRIRAASLVQFAAILTGFVLMTLITTFLGNNKNYNHYILIFNNVIYFQMLNKCYSPFRMRSDACSDRLIKTSFGNVEIGFGKILASITRNPFIPFTL